MALLGPAGICLLVPGVTIGTLQKGAVPGTGRAGPVGREVGEAWKGKAAPREYHPATLQRTGEEPGPRPCPGPGGTESPVMSERVNPAGSVRKLLERTNS